MFQLRDAHLDGFGPEADAHFVARLIEHLRAEHAITVLRYPPPLVEEMVWNGLARARSYGIEWEAPLAAFIVLMFEFAPNFDEHPAARAVLRDPSLPANARVYALNDRLTDRHWEEMVEGCDMDAWFSLPEG